MPLLYCADDIELVTCGNIKRDVTLNITLSAASLLLSETY